MFIAVGVGAFPPSWIKDIGDLLTHLVEHLRFNPESRFVNFVLDKSSLVTDRVLRRIGEVGFTRW